MNDAFALHAQLAAETHPVGELDLSRVLLFDDARFPWLVLVPRLPGKRDLIDLSRDQQHRLLDEIDRASRVLHALTHAEKMNVAALGNVVAQLHVHVVARFAADAAWPRPVWGVGERQPYAPAQAQTLCRRLRSALGLEPAATQ